MNQNEAANMSFEELEAFMAGTPAPENTPETPEQTPEPAEPTPPTETPEAAPAEPVAPPAEEVPAEPEEAPADSKKDKFANLAFKRREAERQAREAQRLYEEERASRERIQRQLDAIQSGKPESATPATPATPTPKDGAFAKPKPLLKDFTTPGGQFYKEGEEYDDAAQRATDAAMEWYGEKRDFEQQQRAIAEASENQRRAILGDVQKAMEEHPDFEDARDTVIREAPEALQVAISNLPRFSEEKAGWTEMVVYLADHPEVAKDVYATFNRNQIQGIAKLGVILEKLKPEAPKARPVAAPPRQAPTPPVSVGGSVAPGPVDLEKLDMNAFALEMSKYIKPKR